MLEAKVFFHKSIYLEAAVFLWSNLKVRNVNDSLKREA